MANHSSFGAFGRHMQRKANRVDRAVAEVLKTAVVTFVETVAKATPILTGQAQSNWLTHVGSPVSFYFENGDSNRAWQDSLSIAKAAVRKVTASDTIHITNNVPYIVKLNNGYSNQAPALFVQGAVLQAAYSLRGIKINL